PKSLNCDKKGSRQCASRQRMGAMFLDHRWGQNMPDETLSPRTAGVWTVIFTDVHFWVPAIVLLAGLIVLHWLR
ncbi:MAG: hypothetical protein WBH24_13500, partial [Candidatus Acidiferrum sp.]